MKLTAEVINGARVFINALRDREIDLRGRKIPVIENLGALKDQVDVLDLTDNEIERLENFPRLRRLKGILLCNNQVSRIQQGLHDVIGNLEMLVLSNNRVSLLSEIDKLAELPRLKLLNLVDNPVCQVPNYRLYVIHKLEHLELLDNDRVRPREREAAAKMFASKAGATFAATIQEQGAAMAKDAGAGAGLVLTTQQKQLLVAALQSAKTAEEIDRIERMLKAGVVPDQETLSKLLGEPQQPATADTQMAEPAEPAKPLEPAEPAKPLEPTERTKPAKPNEPGKAEPEPTLDETAIAAMRVVDLRKELERRGLPTKGLKAQLQARLREHINI